MQIRLNFLRLSNGLLGLLLLKTFTESLVSVDNLAFLNNVSSSLLRTTLILGILASLSFMVGKSPRLSAAVMAITLWSLGFLCPLIRTIGHGYLIFILIFLSLLPRQDFEAGRINKSSANILWFVLGLSYFNAALDKWHHIFWHSGQALELIFKFTPILRDNILTNYLAGNPGMLRPLTFAVILTEALALPFYMVRRLRPYGWMMITFLHLSIVSCLALNDLTFGLLITQCYLLADGSLFKTFKSRNPLMETKQ